MITLVRETADCFGTANWIFVKPGSSNRETVNGATTFTNPAEAFRAAIRSGLHYNANIKGWE